MRTHTWFLLVYLTSQFVFNFKIVFVFREKEKSITYQKCWSFCLLVFNALWSLSLAVMLYLLIIKFCFCCFSCPWCTVISITWMCTFCCFWYGFLQYSVTFFQQALLCWLFAFPTSSWFYLAFFFVNGKPKWHIGKRHSSGLQDLGITQEPATVKRKLNKQLLEPVNSPIICILSPGYLTNIGTLVKIVRGICACWRPC